MALMDFIKKQFIDVIQWTEEDNGTLASAFHSRHGNPEWRPADRTRVAAGGVRQQARWPCSATHHAHRRLPVLT
jgi:membrane protease subunit (stomatin/prohibitin family)